VKKYAKITPLQSLNSQKGLKIHFSGGLFMEANVETVVDETRSSFNQPPKNSGRRPVKTRAGNSFKTEARIFIFAGLFLPIAYLLIFDIGVKLGSFIMPFQDYVTKEWTWENFRRVWWAFTSPAAGDESLWVATKNTLMYFSWNIIQIPVSLFLTYFLFKRIAGKKVFVILYNIPSMVSSIVIVTAFKELTSLHGPLAMIMEATGHPLEQSIYKVAESANAALLSYNIIFGLAGGVMYYHAAMNRIPHTVFEAARIDGVGPFAEAVRIVFPLIMPTVGTQLVLGSMGFLTASGPILLFTKGANGTTTLSFWMYWRIYQDPTGDLGVVSAMGLIMTAIGFPVAALGMWINNHIEPIQY
jgi:ABC-type sugar transport system permease subunit